MQDDGEAIAFGKAVIWDILQDYALHHSGSTMRIRDDERLVSAIPFDFEAGIEKRIA